jgi:hypothetical protein
LNSSREITSPFTVAAAGTDVAVGGADVAVAGASVGVEAL